MKVEEAVARVNAIVIKSGVGGKLGVYDSCLYDLLHEETEKLNELMRNHSWAHFILWKGLQAAPPDRVARNAWIMKDCVNSFEILLFMVISLLLQKESDGYPELELFMERVVLRFEGK